VMPDHEVPVSIHDLVVSRDRALETAQEILRKAVADGSAKRGG